MSFRNPARWLRDILDVIVMIKRFTDRIDFESFREDPKTVAAVERKLLIISEVAIRLGDEAAILCPDQPWHKVRGTGNWIRHQYERIETTPCAGVGSESNHGVRGAMEIFRKKISAPSD